MATPLLPRISFLRSFSSSRCTPHISQEFLQSSSATHVNPRSHPLITDTVSQILPQGTVPCLDDEQLLVQLTLGFFAGFVFGFERLALRAGAWRFLPVTFTDLYPDPDAQTIWNAREIPCTQLLPVGSRLFGAFVVLDKHIASSSDPRASYVDYAFGSDQYNFAGCHRFQIRHSQQSQPSVQMEQQQMCVNLQKNIPAVPGYGQRFHALYAKWLFANGIQCLEDNTSIEKRHID